MDDKNTFQVQRRNVILASLAVILYVHGGGKPAEDTRFGFIPIELAEPEILIYAAVIMFGYFCYRFWVCGGNNTVFAFKELKQKIFLRTDGWESSLHGEIIANIKDDEIRSAAGISSKRFQRLDPTLYTYTLTSTKNNITGAHRLRIWKYPKLFIKGFWWALRNDSTLSDYLIPFSLALYAWLLILTPYDVSDLLQYIKPYLTDLVP